MHITKAMTRMGSGPMRLPRMACAVFVILSLVTLHHFYWPIAPHIDFGIKMEDILLHSNKTLPFVPNASDTEAVTPPSSAEESNDEWVPEEHDILEATKNATLGFGQIFYISLPHRTDRQDSMELLAKMSNLTLTLQPGALGALIDDKAKPQAEGANLRPEQWGCWRSHVDLWRKIVKENIETALITEDDLDWDVNIHDVMHRLGHQMRAGSLRNSTMTAFEETSAPYGLDWDTLHIGTCFDWPSEPLPKHITYEDPHSPGRSDLNGVYLSQMENVWKLPIEDSSTFRVLYPAWNPVCTIGYAVTQRGAQRLLYNIGIQPIHDPVDMAMIGALRKGVMRGYSVVPPVMTTWKFGSAKDSDIDDVEEQKRKGMFMEGSKNLRNSARRALGEFFKENQTPLTDLSVDQVKNEIYEEEERKKEGKKAEEEAKKKEEEKKEEAKKKEEEEAKKKEDDKKKEEEEAKKKEDDKKAEEAQKIGAPKKDEKAPENNGKEAEKSVEEPKKYEKEPEKSEGEAKETKMAELKETDEKKSPEDTKITGY